MNMFFKRQNQASTAIVVASIKAKIAKEQTRILELEAKYGAAALDAETGDDKHLNEVNSELANAKNNLARFQAALVEAKKREQAEIAARLEAEWLKKVEIYKNATNSFAAQADRLRKTLSQYVVDYKKLVERGSECLRANPTGALIPGTLFDSHHIHNAVALELARLQDPIMGETPSDRVPGTAMPSTIYDPKTIKSFIEVVLDSIAIALKAAKKGRLP